MSGKMNCEFFQKNLNAYLDSELGEDARAAMIAHAQDCPACGALLDDMTRMMTMYAELDEDIVMPLDGQAAWRNAIREEAKKGKKPRISAWTRSVGAIAAALVLLISGTVYYRGAQPLSSNENAPMMAQQRALMATANDEAGYGAGDLPSTGAALSGKGLVLESDGSAADGLLLTDEMEPETQDATGAGETRTAMVILRATREIETSAYDSDILNIQDLISEYEGSTDSSSRYGQPIEAGQQSGRVLYMTVRIPSERLEEFLTALNAVGTVTYASETADDISSRYYDAQARLDVMKEQHTRLKELIADADSLTDIIELEDKLYAVQADIDSLEGQLRGWGNQVSMSTVDITLREIAPRDKVQPIADSLGERVKNGFFDSVNWLMRFLQDMAVMLAMIAPQLVIVIPLVIVIVVIVKIVRRRRRNR